MHLIISKKTPGEMYPFCQESLESYVQACEVLHVEQFLSYNVHSLLHLAADVELLCGMQTFSTFGFENNIPAICECVRRPGLKLQQYFERELEINDNSSMPIDDIPIRHLQMHAGGSRPKILLQKIVRNSESN